MGISTDAYLVWGIQVEDGWGVDVEEPDEEETPPTVEYRLAVDGATVEGVYAVSHCSSENPMYILTDVAYNRAWRGSPRVIDPSEMIRGNAAKIREFAAKHDIPLTGDPAWWLCSWWS